MREIFGDGSNDIVLPQLDDDRSFKNNNDGTTYDDDHQKQGDQQDTREPRNKTQFNENVTSSSSMASYTYDEEGEAEIDEPSISAPFQHLTHGNVEIEEEAEDDDDL